MKYYVIINGNSSLNIQGLAIESLPNISKPLIRTTREEIDGRDGDIITKLGYSAYDKTLNIGLWGNYDINEVIAFFNQEGVITFSNEPDKYYKFTIVNRIDFVNELEKFKKASITIHCQPFKYQEQPEIVAEEEAVELAGTSFTISDSLEAPLLIDLKGNTSQNTLSGKNLFDTNNLTLNTLSGLTSSIKDATLKLNGTNSSQGYIITTSSTGVVLPAGTYTLSMVVKGTCNILDTNYNTVLYLLNGNTNASFHNMSFRTTYYNSSKTQSSQFTLTDPTPISVQMYTNGSVAYNNIEIMMQIESGSSFTGFEPYCGGVPSPNPSYTQNVNVVSGDNDIVVCGKNLFDKSDNILTGKYYDNTTGEIKTTTTANNYLQEIYIKVTPNTQYTISAGANCQYLRMVEYNINKTFIKTNTSDTSNTMTRTLTENTQYVRLSMAGENVLDTLQLEKGSTATTYTPYTGTTYPVNLPVENLCNGINQNIWISGSYDLVGIGTSNSGLIIPANGGYYTISTTETQSRYRACCVDTLPTSGQNVPGYNGVLYDNTKRVITINTSGHNYLVVDATDLTKVQIEQGSKANTYTPYGTTPIELCKIGTYQDYIYKENDKWYLHKEIGKVDMSSITGYDGANGQFYKTGFVSGYGIKNDTLYSNIFLYSTTTWLDLHFGITSTGNLWLSTGDTTLTPSTINTWLSNKNAILYGILKTPTNTEITYQPLINQLNALEDAESYEGTTNINQVNNDLPFIIGLTYFTGDNTITITNDGNIYSKPLLRIKGTSDISISLNGIQIFQITLQNNETIIIDTEKMEAYYDGILKNRQVIGDYNNFKLNPGENTIEINGAFDYVRISRYSRWV